MQRKKISVIGSGYLGTQIAMLTAYTGYEVKVFDSREGAFGILDKTGLGFIYDIEMVYYRDFQDPKERPTEALREKIERGELGVKSGKGFYSYLNPEYLSPDFLNPSE